MKKNECCTADCNQGRNCPLKSARENQGVLVLLKIMLLNAIGRKQRATSTDIATTREKP